MLRYYFLLLGVVLSCLSGSTSNWILLANYSRGRFWSSKLVGTMEPFRDSSSTQRSPNFKETELTLSNFFFLKQTAWCINGGRHLEYTSDFPSEKLKYYSDYWCFTWIVFLKTESTMCLNFKISNMLSEPILSLSNKLKLDSLTNWQICTLEFSSVTKENKLWHL